MEYSGLKDIIYNAGIVGAGGAGFPSHIKLPKKADVVVINCVECEPLLYADKYILENYFAEIIEGASYVAEASNAGEIYIAAKQKVLKNLDLSDNVCMAKNGKKVHIKEVRDIYPAGDEVILTYEVTGKIIPEGKLPISCGVVVYNGETVLNIYNAVDNNKNVTCKYLTVSGDVPFPYMTKVPVGYKSSGLFRKAGIEDFDDYFIVSGGPLMGEVIAKPDEAYVTKTTNGYIILKKSHSLAQLRQVSANSAYKRANSACCQCRMCSDMCPRFLLGYDLEVHKVLRTVANNITDDFTQYSRAALCCGCGICTYFACQQGILPGRVCFEVKGLLQKNKAPLKFDKAPEKVREEREGRLVSSEMIARRCGLSKYLGINPAFFHDLPDLQLYRFYLKQHTGAKAFPCVRVNDQIREGGILAEVKPDMVGANVHSSVSGVITAITDTYIEVNKK